jgi:ribosomal protein S18 acetylase RimI-like enzyme
MMHDFAEFEKLLDSFKVTELSLASAMFGPAGFVECLIVEEGESPVGYMLFYPCFASFSGQMGLYLEDIYVKPSHRGQGVGEAMLRRLAQTARERACERIDFQVLDWNTPAIRFYEKLGAVRNDDERHFKFSGEAFERLAG